MKKIGGVGTPADSCIVNGVVCRKNLAHKRMRKHILSARILMVGGNVEFNRTQFRLASLESLTKQQVPHSSAVDGPTLNFYLKSVLLQ